MKETCGANVLHDAMKLTRLTKLLLIHCGWIELAQADIRLALLHRHNDTARYQRVLALAAETIGYAKKAFATWQAKAFC